MDQVNRLVEVTGIARRTLESSARGLSRLLAAVQEDESVREDKARRFARLVGRYAARVQDRHKVTVGWWRVDRLCSALGTHPRELARMIGGVLDGPIRTFYGHQWRVGVDGRAGWHTIEITAGKTCSEEAEQLVRILLRVWRRAARDGSCEITPWRMTLLLNRLVAQPRLQSLMMDVPDSFRSPAGEELAFSAQSLPDGSMLVVSKPKHGA